MGQDMHIRVARYNKDTNLYEELELFRKVKPNDYPRDNDINGFRKIYIEAGRDYEMFQGMKDGDERDGYGYFPWDSINYPSLESSFAESIKEYEKIDGTFDFHEINLSEFKLYLKNHPTVTDYDASWGDDWKYEDPTPQKENPIKSLLENIENYISVADEEYSWTPNVYYKIIFFFDW